MSLCRGTACRAPTKRIKQEPQMKNNSAEKILVTGGARSGKSDFAISMANAFSRKIFLATAQPIDEEMAERIEKHRTSRGTEWRAVEEPLELIEAIKKLATEAEVIVVDCITLWINNLLMRGDSKESVINRFDELAETVEHSPVPLIIVTNEVGSGIVPENRLARDFRDLAGLANRKLAAACNRVVFMVAGIPQKIKG